MFTGLRTGVPSNKRSLWNGESQKESSSEAFSTGRHVSFGDGNVVVVPVFCHDIFLTKSGPKDTMLVSSELPVAARLNCVVWPD